MKFTSIHEMGAKRKTLWVKDNQPVKGVFRGDIHEFKIHWVNKQKVTCTGTECTHCLHGNLKPGFQFRVNFIHRDPDGKLMASIYEGDWFTYKRLNKLNESAPLETSLVTISKGLDNGYRTDLFEKVSSLDENNLKAIAGVQLHSLLDPIAQYEAIMTEKNFDDIPF